MNVGGPLAFPHQLHRDVRTMPTANADSRDAVDTSGQLGAEECTNNVLTKTGTIVGRNLAGIKQDGRERKQP